MPVRRLRGKLAHTGEHQADGGEERNVWQGGRREEDVRVGNINDAEGSPGLSSQFCDTAAPLALNVFCFLVGLL